MDVAPQAFTALKATLKAVARCTTVSRFVRGYALASYVRVSYSMIADLNMNARCAVTRRVPSRLIAVALQTVSIGRCDILSVHLSQLNLFTEVGGNNLGRTSVWPWHSPRIAAEGCPRTISRAVGLRSVRIAA